MATTRPILPNTHAAEHPGSKVLVSMWSHIPISSRLL